MLWPPALRPRRASAQRVRRGGHPKAGLGKGTFPPEFLPYTVRPCDGGEETPGGAQPAFGHPANGHWMPHSALASINLVECVAEIACMPYREET